MTEYITRDSGARQDFTSGARRDISTGKPRYDLISLPALRRWAELMGRGADKYGSRNWELGMPASRFAESGLRHFFQYMEGDRTEDHLAAVLFNIGAMIHFTDTEWDDINMAQQLELPFPETPKSSGWFAANSVSVAQVPFVPKAPNVSLDEPAQSMVNWTQLKLDVAEGKIDGSTVRWPEEAPEG